MKFFRQKENDNERIFGISQMQNTAVKLYKLHIVILSK